MSNRERPRLRLFVPPPYEGESLSSFLGRSAQAYRMTQLTLVTELMGSERWPRWRRDIDRTPPEALILRLAEAVARWRSPVTDIVGFNFCSLTSAKRRAYCPKCFLGDFEAGRVPYFRFDWAAVAVTHCWKHSTPLFDWEFGPVSVRTLPQGWVDLEHSKPMMIPPCMREHLAALNRWEDEPASSPLRGTFDLLRKLQHTFEKPAAAARDQRPSTLAHVLFECVARLAVHAQGQLGPVASYLRPRWSEPLALSRAPPDLGPRQREYRDNLFRQGAEVAWRRTYLWFIATTMAGIPTLTECATASATPWEHWWDKAVRPGCPKPYTQVIDYTAGRIRAIVAGSAAKGV